MSWNIFGFITLRDVIMYIINLILSTATISSARLFRCRQREIIGNKREIKSSAKYENNDPGQREAQRCKRIRKYDGYMIHWLRGRLVYCLLCEGEHYQVKKGRKLARQLCTDVKPQLRGLSTTSHGRNLFSYIFSDISHIQQLTWVSLRRYPSQGRPP